MRTIFRFCQKALTFKVFVFYVISFLLFVSVFSSSVNAQDSQRIAAVRNYSQPESSNTSPGGSQNQTQYPTPKPGDTATITTSQGKQETGKVLSTQNNDQVTIQTQDGRTETGKVLACIGSLCTPDEYVDDILGGITGSIGGLASAIAEAIWDVLIGDVGGRLTSLLGKVWGWLKGQLLNILMTVIYWLTRLISAVFGFSIDVAQDSFAANPFEPLKTAMGDTTVIDASTMRFNALTFSSMAIGGVYQNIPDTSVPQYLAYEIQDNILGVKPTYAQGVGTSSLGDGIRSIWAKVRDLALIAMVLVLIVMGFMIMFRKRLNPQASVTVMNSIPRVAIALVLITFSFAISGLFIDLAYVTVNILRSYMNNMGPFSGFFQFLSAKLGGELIWFPVFAIFTGAQIIDWATFMNFFTAGPLFTDIIGTVAGIILLFIPFMIMSFIEIIIRLTLVAVSIYLFWILIKNFAFMVVYTIFSPVFFIIGAIPGFESATINWMKRMLSSALVFPIVLLFLYLSLAFMLASSPTAQLFGHLNSVFHGDLGELTNLTSLDSVKTPPPIGSSILNISYLLGIGILFFATKVPQFLEKLFKIDSLDIRGGLGYGVLAAPLAIPYGIVAGAGKGNPITGASTLINYGKTAGRVMNERGYTAPTRDTATGQPVPPQPNTNVRFGGLSRFGAKVLSPFIPEQARRWPKPGETPAQHTTRIEEHQREEAAKAAAEATTQKGTTQTPKSPLQDPSGAKPKPPKAY